MATMPISNNKWSLSLDAPVTATGTSTTGTTITKTFSTAGRFVDKDIEIKITPKATVASATPTTAYTNTGMGTYFNAGTSSDNNVVITPNYSNSAGYVSAHSATNNGGIGYWKIKTTTRSAGSGTATLAAGTGDSESSSNNSLTLYDEAPAGGAVFYTLTATGKGAVSTGTGWVTSGSTISETDTKYGYIVKSVHMDVISGSIPSSLTGRSNYQDIEIQPNGYVRIPPGYNPLNRYIWANKADEQGESIVASNYSLDVSNITGGTNVVTVGTLSGDYYPLTQSNLGVTATLTAGTAGWFSSGSASASNFGSVSVGKIPKAIGSVALTTDLKKTPVISRTAKPSGDTWTDAANGAATTTKPNSGVYVQVNTAAATGTTTATAKITTAGYSPTNNSFATSSTATYGANASANTYVPIKTVTPAFTGGAITGSVTNITGSNVTLSTTNNGISVQGTATASRAAVSYSSAVSGWVTASANATALSASNNNSLTSLTKYITGITVPQNTPFNLTLEGNLDADSSIISVTSGYNRKLEVQNDGETTVNNYEGNVFVESCMGQDGNVYLTPYGESDSLQLVSSGELVIADCTLNMDDSRFNISVNNNLNSNILAATSDTGANGLSISGKASLMGYGAEFIVNDPGLIRNSMAIDHVYSDSSTAPSATASPLYLTGIKLIKPSSGTSTFNVTSGASTSSYINISSPSSNTTTIPMNATIYNTNVSMSGGTFKSATTTATTKVVTSSNEERGTITSYGGGSTQNGVLGFTPSSSTVGSLYATAYSSSTSYSKKIIENGQWQINYKNTTERTSTDGFCFKAGSYYYCFRWYSTSSNRFQFERTTSTQGTLLDTIMPNEMIYFRIYRTFSSIQNHWVFIVSPSANVVIGIDTNAGYAYPSGNGYTTDPTSISYYNRLAPAVYQTFPTSWTDLYYFRNKA